MRKRFIIATRDGRFVACVYADRYERRRSTNSFTGATGGDFFMGEHIIASVDDDEYYLVGDSGGRLQETVKCH